MSLCPEIMNIVSPKLQSVQSEKVCLLCGESHAIVKNLRWIQGKTQMRRTVLMLSGSLVLVFPEIPLHSYLFLNYSTFFGFHNLICLLFLLKSIHIGVLSLDTKYTYNRVQSRYQRGCCIVTFIDLEKSLWQISWVEKQAVNKHDPVI